jgi:hypothetical protein
MSRYDTLREAVRSDNFELLLETHLGILNITANDSDYNLLHYSILNKQYNSVEWLLKNGADPEIRNHYGRTCIEEAMLSFDPTMIQIISKYTGFNINAYDGNGHTYVHQYICTGNLSLLSVFYNSKPDIDFNKPTQYGLSTIDLLMQTLMKITDASIRLNRIQFVQSICDKEEIFIFSNKNKIADFSSNLISFNAFIYDIFRILKINNPYKILIQIMNQPRNLEHIRKKVSGQDFFTYLLMNNYLTNNYEIESTTSLILSGIFNMDNINDSGLNIFQFIIAHRPTLLSFLEHILIASTVKSKVLSIFSICKGIGINISSNVDDESDINEEYKAFRRKVKSYVTKDVFLKLANYSSNIISILDSMGFRWNKIIQPGEIIPFQDCNLFVWALKNNLPLAKVFLEKSSNNIDWNSFIMTDYSINDHTSPTKSTSSPFSIAIRGGSKLSYIRDLMLERLAINPVPFDPSKYFNISDIKSNLFIQNIIEKGLVQVTHFIQASPSNLIQYFPKSLWKFICLQEKLHINKLTISGNPITSIPPEHFVILMNCVAWDIRELYSFIKSNPSNSFDSNDTLIDPSFIGHVIDHDDLYVASFYADPHSPDTPNFMNYYYKALFLENFLSYDISLLRKWSSIMISSGSDFNRELATFLKKPISLDIYKQTIATRNKQNNIILSLPIQNEDLSKLDKTVVPIILQLRECAFNHLLSWYMDLNDKQKKVFVSFFSIAIFGIEPSSQNFLTCGIQLKHKLDVLSVNNLHLFNGVDLI